jgi:hypothetical protein
MNTVPKAVSDLTAQPETSQAQAVATANDQKEVNMKTRGQNDGLVLHHQSPFTEETTKTYRRTESYSTPP